MMFPYLKNAREAQIKDCLGCHYLYLPWSTRASLLGSRLEFHSTFHSLISLSSSSQFFTNGYSLLSGLFYATFHVPHSCCGIDAN